MSDILELKKVIEDQGRAWTEFRDANDKLLAAKADGKAVGDLEQKLATLSAELDKLSDTRELLEEMNKKFSRPATEASTKDAADFALELKQFNAALRGHRQEKGLPLVAFDDDGYRQYKSAFFKLTVAGDKGLNADEVKALQAGSDPDGGYLLPHSTVGRVIVKMFEQSVMRQICDVVTISTNKIEGLIDNDEADAGWVSELGTRSNTDTPQVAKYEIEAHEMYAMPKASQRILDDAATDVEAWLAGKVADKFGRVEGNGYINGTGVGQARGLFTVTTAATSDESRTWGQFEHVVTGANGDFHTTKADPLQDLLGAFKPQYLNNASFLMRREVRTKIRKFKEATSDRYLWEPSLQAGQPDRLLGYPVRTDQYLPTLATGSLSLAFGDFRQAYTIVDRLGIRTLRDPYTAKPYVVFYSTKRTGGGPMNSEAVKFLKFST